jgi:N-acetylglucosamine-6-sulfatase/uncharacterized sulfatase
MTQRLTRRTFGLAAAVGVRRSSFGQTAAPNLVYVFPDQWRAQALGFLHQDPVYTPNLDAFSRQSLVLTHAISNAPVCSPYRAMLMTGRYPLSNGVTRNCTTVDGVSAGDLRATDTCFPDVLKAAGYSTGYIGKWHLDAPHPPYIDTSNNRGRVKWNEWTPPNRRHGFSFWHAYGVYDNHNTPEYWDTDSPRDGRRMVRQWGPEHETDLAIRYTKNEGGKFRKQGDPFTLFVAHNPPHTDYEQVPPRYLKPYEDKTWRELINRPNFHANAGTELVEKCKHDIRYYFAQITGVDDQFGRLLRTLDDCGLSDNTIVIFTSDHGNCIGSNNEITKNNPYDEALRIPFMIRWPKVISPRHDSLLLSVPDIMPTTLSLMGLGARIPRVVQGSDYSTLVRGGEQTRPTSALYFKSEQGEERGVRTTRYTLAIRVRGGERDEVRLFDNEADPFQMNNLANSTPKLVHKLMREELEPWLRRTGDPWPKPVSVLVRERSPTMW